MPLTFRWYGPTDPVPLEHIRQIPGVTGVVAALYDVPPGEAWTREGVAALKAQVEDAGLSLDVIESVPVHESIKLGTEGRDRALDAFCRSVEAVGAEGVKVVCYNFMPVFDWVRTELARRRADGATTLAYRHSDLPRVERGLAEGGLPGWIGVPGGEKLARLRAAYERVDAEALWDHLGYFLERAVPVAEASGVRLALHPDDPPWPVFGLPRIVTSAAAYDRVLDLVDSPANAATLCTGSLGARPDEATRLPETARRLAERDRLGFVHLRNVRHGEGAAAEGPCDFEETAHPEGRVDLAAVVWALKEVGYDGPVRPDHGRMIWDEVGQEDLRAGYGLYDRALGAAYLLGLWHAA